MTDNYDEINEQFKLQTQHVFVVTSLELDELSSNTDNYTLLQTIKCFTIQQML